MAEGDTKRVPDIRLSKHFFDELNSWHPKYTQIKTKQHLATLAVNEFDEKLKSLSEKQLKTFDERNMELLRQWKVKGWIDKKSRGLGK